MDEEAEVHFDRFDVGGVFLEHTVASIFWHNYICLIRGSYPHHSTEESGGYQRTKNVFTVGVQVDESVVAIARRGLLDVDVRKPDSFVLL